MRSSQPSSRAGRRLLACLLLAASPLRAADVSGEYYWNSVRIGSGGLVTGIIIHPTNTSVRYCRTDVGNAYRWDTTLNEWVPMIVRRADGTGLPADVAAVPAVTGCSSIAVDPANPDIVLMSFPAVRDVTLTAYPSLLENVYRSTDGGRNFVKANLSVPGEPNGNSRNLGERLKFDPNNSNVVYYCSYASGLFRSVDGGLTWAQVTGGGAPGAPADPKASQTTLNVHFFKDGGVTVNPAIGQIVSSVIYVTGCLGSIYRSADGGQTWTNISSAIALNNRTGMSTLDHTGTLWLTFWDPSYFSANRSPNANTIWKYSMGTWTSRPVPVDQTYGQTKCVAVDPANANRLFLLTQYGCFHRSLDGGTTWQKMGPYVFSNTVAWLPRPTSGRSNGGVFFDTSGKLWSTGGAEGVMYCTPTLGNTESSLSWKMEFKGIEEMVARDIIVPKGSGDRIITAEYDMSGHRITNPDKFTATMLPVQNVQPLSAGSSVAACPNAIDSLAIFSTDIFKTGTTYKGWNFSAKSTDGGLTWAPFASNPNTFNAGNIAVSRRAPGATVDRMVMLPAGRAEGGENGKPPYYSHDGGATWTPTASFPLASWGDLVGLQTSTGRYFIGFANAVYTQRSLRADPFVPDKYYLKLYAGGFYVSTDGGVNWTDVPGNGLPNWVINGQLEVNHNVQDDLWFADGFRPPSGLRGLFHSAPGSNNVFTRIPGIDFAYTLALGAGRGLSGDAPYTVYFYGKMTNDAAWGVFRSTDAGSTWDRVCYYPGGVFDRPSCMAASWDTFGSVYVGFLGHSYIYGRPKYAAFTQSFGTGSQISNYLDTEYNRFGTIQQGTAGGFSINANEELVMTDGTDSYDHSMIAKTGNLAAPLDRGFIFKGKVRAAGNPNSYNNQVFGFLQFGTDGTGVAMMTNIRIGGTPAAPTASFQPTNGLTTGSANSTTGAPFWLVVNKTGSDFTYTRPDGLSKTLANNQYDLWFGTNGNDGAQLNKNLFNTTRTINSFWFQTSGYYYSPGASVAFDNIKAASIDIGTTQF